MAFCQAPCIFPGFPILALFQICIQQQHMVFHIVAQHPDILLGLLQKLQLPGIHLVSLKQAALCISLL